METVKLTPKERASFIFQLRILQKLSDSSEFSDYEAKIIESVIMGKIDIYDLDFEDYPSEMTMKRWIKSQKQTNTLI